MELSSRARSKGSCGSQVSGSWQFCWVERERGREKERKRDRVRVKNEEDKTTKPLLNPILQM